MKNYFNVKDIKKSALNADLKTLEHYANLGYSLSPFAKSEILRRKKKLQNPSFVNEVIDFLEDHSRKKSRLWVTIQSLSEITESYPFASNLTFLWTEGKLQRIN